MVIELTCLAATIGAFLLGYIIAGIFARERNHLDAQQLGSHGRRLLAIAHELRDIAAGKDLGVDVRRPDAAIAIEWAGDLEAIAFVYAECANCNGYPEPWLDDLVGQQGDP